MEKEIINADCIAAMQEMPPESVDAIVTDPPYGLSFMGKKWDYDVPSVDVWRECLRVLKPGGHLLAFAGTRTQHRMACAIEDAGFEMRDMIAWVYGSGFPKSLDVSKAIDKRGGNSHLTAEIGAAIKASRLARGVSIKDADARYCGGSTLWTWFEGRPAGQQMPAASVMAAIAADWPELQQYAEAISEAEREVVATVEASRLAVAPGQGNDRSGRELAITTPATDAARQWQGWGTALKPSMEPITVARKPLIGTVAENVLAHGTGALNVDGCRIDYQNDADNYGNGFCKASVNGRQFADGASGFSTGRQHEPQAGRWPANLIHDGSDEVVGLFPDTGKGNGKGSYSYLGVEYNNKATSMFNGDRPQSPSNYNDTGSAARFFYCAKASKRDRDEGLDHMPDRLTRRYGEQGQGPEPQQTPRRDVAQRNHHPTVKPIALMRYLCRLITPPGGTVLDPFMGSGSTGKAAILEGFNFIGIEREAEYAEIARARIEHAERNKEMELPL